MSYARFGWDDSDVYVFEHAGGFIQCCACALQPTEENDIFPGSVDLNTAREALAHLDQHMAAGHSVPAKTFERIREEHPDLDKQIEKYAPPEYEFDGVTITTESGSTYKLLRNICHKQDAAGNMIDTFKVFYITGVTDADKNMDDVFKRAQTEERRLPKVGERMYVSGRDGWWLSTKVVKVQKKRRAKKQ